MSDFTPRRPGTSATHENRGLANEAVDRETLHREILAALKAHGKLTASQCALVITGDPVRQRVAPRMTELEKAGKIEQAGSTRDQWSGRRVTVYQIMNEGRGNE